LLDPAVTVHRIASPRDHAELALNNSFAFVTDRGRVHSENQDAVSIVEVHQDSSRTQIIVLCDGVSSSQHAAQASAKGSKAACDSLVRLLKARVGPVDAIKLSTVVADRAVRKIPFDTLNKHLHPPGATIVAAIVAKSWLSVGWIGDSRCYWIDENSVQLLTHDHSWVNYVVDNGVLSQEKAEKKADSHRISRCIGPIFSSNSKEDEPPSVTRFRITKPGRILVCSDGLWNYFPQNADRLAAVLQTGTNSVTALRQAQTLVEYACAQGGKDNVTAAILAVA
jgi:serine/threonine protein phosphatase PrpC